MTADLSCPGTRRTDRRRNIWASNSDRVVCWAPFSQEAVEPLGGCCNASVAVEDEWPEFYDFPGIETECIVWCSMVGNGTMAGDDEVFTDAMQCLTEYRNSTWGARVRCNRARDPPPMDLEDPDGDGSIAGDAGDGDDAASLVRSGGMAGLMGLFVSLLLASGIAF